MGLGGSPVPSVTPHQRGNEDYCKDQCKNDAAGCEHFFRIRIVQKYIFEQ